MRWFKHPSDSQRDQKLASLLTEMGWSGYGLYWGIIELLAEQIKHPHDVPSLKFPEKKWARILETYPAKFKKFTQCCKRLELFSVETKAREVCFAYPDLLKLLPKDFGRTQLKRRKVHAQADFDAPQVREKTGQDLGYIGPTSFQSGQVVDSPIPRDLATQDEDPLLAKTMKITDESCLSAGKNTRSVSCLSAGKSTPPCAPSPVKSRRVIQPHQMNTPDTQPPSEASNPACVPFFKRFWEAWPLRNGKRLGRQACWSFVVEKRRVKEADFEKIETGVKHYAASRAVVSGYAMNPLRFLEEAAWKDWQAPEEEAPRKQQQGAQHATRHRARDTRGDYEEAIVVPLG